jgi:hypothetical protein
MISSQNKAIQNSAGLWILSTILPMCWRKSTVSLEFFRFPMVKMTISGTSVNEFIRRRNGKRGKTLKNSNKSAVKGDFFKGDNEVRIFSKTIKKHLTLNHDLSFIMKAPQKN